MPGHVAGSLCGAGMSEERSSTIGQERRFNPALALATVEEFVAESVCAPTPRPPNMEHIVELNRGPFVGAPPAVGPVARDGHFVLDVRDADAHAAGHAPGAVNVPVSGSSFGTKAAFLIPNGSTIALHADSPAQAARAASKLHAVGFLELAGYLEDATATETLEPVDIDELERLIAEGSVDVIDVREPSERDAGYIPGSRNIPYRVIARVRRRPRRRQAARDGLRDRAARGDRRERARRGRPQGAARAPRRRLRMGAPRQPDRRVPPLRL